MSEFFFAAGEHPVSPGGRRHPRTQTSSRPAASDDFVGKRQREWQRCRFGNPPPAEEDDGDDRNVCQAHEVGDGRRPRGPPAPAAVSQARWLHKRRQGSVRHTKALVSRERSDISTQLLCNYVLWSVYGEKQEQLRAQATVTWGAHSSANVSIIIAPQLSLQLSLHGQSKKLGLPQISPD